MGQGTIDVSTIPEERRRVELVIRVPEELAADEHGFMGGWWAVRTAGDIVTLLAVRLDGDLSLLRRYEEVDFLSVVYAGEYLRFRGELVRVGNTSRTIEIVGERLTKKVEGFATDYLKRPEKVFGARAIIVVPKQNQRKSLTDEGS